MAFFWTSEGGKSFREYFKNKPGNLFSNIDILLGTSQRTIYKFLKNFLFFFKMATLFGNITGFGEIQQNLILKWNRKKLCQ
jgi:hypothetical protein